MRPKISVIGLGKLGCSMAAAFASRGFEVVGVDVDRRSVEMVNDGLAPVQETGLGELIAANRDRIHATVSHREAVLNSDISFVIVPTPTDDEGAFSLQYAKWAFAEIGKALAEKADYHVVVLTSTVLPGATRAALVPILERESRKKAGSDFGVCYSPEFIALGSIIQNFLNPDFTLIGEFDERSGTYLEELYSQVVNNGAPSSRMSIENAELAKICVNSFVTTKITFANMVAAMCEQIPGGDVDVVTGALGLDKRIGRNYLTGAGRFGGPCFPRDNVALSVMAEYLGIGASLPKTVDLLNQEVSERIVRQVTSELRKGSTVAVLGLAYKPFSHVVEGSQGMALAEELSMCGFRVVAYDPLSDHMPIEDLKGRVLVLSSVEECLKQAEAVVIATADPEFAALEASDLLGQFEVVKVFDVWRLLRNKLVGNPRISYFGTGLSVPDSSALNERLRSRWVDRQDGASSASS